MRYTGLAMWPLFLASLLLLASCTGPPISPLAAAARQGDIQAIHALVNAGADPNAPSGVNHWTPLQHAIHKNQRASVHALLDAGADVNRSAPLAMAAGYGQADIVAGLLARGARNYPGALNAAITGVPDIDAFTLLKCQPETVKVLLNHSPGLKPDFGPVNGAIAWLKNCPAI